MILSIRDGYPTYYGRRGKPNAVWLIVWSEKPWECSGSEFKISATTKGVNAGFFAQWIVLRENVQETMDFFATVLWISCVLDWKRPKICRVRATQVWGFLGWFGELLLESTRRRLHRPVLSVQESLDVRLTSNDLCHGTKMRFLVTARLWFRLWFGTTAKNKRKIPTKERVWLVPCCYGFARNDFHICSFGGEQSNTKKKQQKPSQRRRLRLYFWMMWYIKNTSIHKINRQNLLGEWFLQSFYRKGQLRVYVWYVM